MIKTVESASTSLPSLVGVFSIVSQESDSLVYAYVVAHYEGNTYVTNDWHAPILETITGNHQA
jgi:hypothetical protein